MEKMEIIEIIELLDTAVRYIGILGLLMAGIALVIPRKDFQNNNFSEVAVIGIILFVLSLICGVLSPIKYIKI